MTNHQSPITNHGQNETRENEMLANNEEIKATVGAQFHCANASGGSAANSSRSIAALLQGAGIALAALLLAPGAALADNECGAQVDPGNPETVVCTADQPGGITYTTDGDLTVDTGTSGTRDVGSNGVNLTSINGDAVTLDVVGELGFSTSANPSPSDWLVDIDTSGTATINVEELLRRNTSGPSGHNTNAESLIRAAGAGNLVINNNGEMTGAVDFSGLQGGVTINIAPTMRDSDASGWITNGNSVLSPASDVVHVQADAFFQTSSARFSTHPSRPETTIDFGAGSDSFLNEGIFIAGTAWQCLPGSDCDPRESSTNFLNLEQFENSNLILLGANTNSVSFIISGERESDRQSNDALALPGADFAGSGDSRIELDVGLGSAGQTACAPETVNADCVNITNGSTSGNTVLTVREVTLADRTSNADFVLIDVSGGTSSADHFTLDSDSDFYSTKFGVPSIYKGDLFFYPFVYDTSTQQHILAATASDNALQFPLLVEAAETGWRTATTGISERQIARRDNPGIGGGLWIHATREEGDRVAEQTRTGGGLTFEYDNSHELRSSAVNVGLDLLSQRDGDRTWSMGGTIGYSRTTAAFDHSPNRAQFEGIALGVYGSYLFGDFFVDSIVSHTRTELDFDMPGLGLVLGPNANTVKTDADSIGARIEGGWSLNLGALGVEPLASLSYVRSDFDNAEVPSGDRSRPGNTIDFGDNTSLRGGLGARLTFDTNLGGLPTTWNLTGRALKEFDEESEATIKSLGPDAKVASELDDMITEVSGGVSVHSASGAASAYLNADLKFSDTYDSEGLSAGFRYQW